MSRALFIIGGIGMLLLGILASIYWVLYFLYDAFLWMVVGSEFWIFMLVTSAIMSVALILAGLGFLGIKMKYNQMMGLIAFIFVFVFGFFLPISDVLSVLGVYVYISPLSTSLDTLVWILGFFFLGLIILFFAITLLMVREKTGKSVLALIASIFLMIAAIGYMAVIGALFANLLSISALWQIVVIQPGSIPLMIGGILTAVVFFTADN